jgi:hypothetical protein
LLIKRKRKITESRYFGIKREKKRSKNAKGHDECVCVFFLGQKFARKKPVQLIQSIFVKKNAKTVRFQIYEIAIF